MKSYFNLAEAFYNVSEQNRQNVAIAYENHYITYQELNKSSNQLANHFLSLGIKKQDVIGIFNTKDILGYASMLACLKIGAIYTNIDEENPLARLEKILTTCQPKLLISDHEPNDVIVNAASDLKIKLINLYSDHAYKHQDDNNLTLSKDIIGSNPAYIMFTSGSTGTPKGVTISHANILSFLAWSTLRYEITSNDRFAQVSPMYFDNSVFDFYTALFSGASLAPINKDITKKPLELVNLVDTLECTIWFSVPSLLVYLLTMRVLTKDVFKKIRIFTFGGEGFPKGELNKLYQLYKERASLINVYGPTEGTCICSSYTISAKDFDDMNNLAPLGIINPNFDYIIVDKDMQSIQSGEKGELCLIGPNIGLGYYNDIDRTSTSFIQNPLIKTHRDIIYRTGDIVYQKNKMLWFAGRSDNQIKHMGYRIELEEIESALHGIPYINQSAVIYNRINSNYGKIVAFIATHTNTTEAQIKKDLQNSLPDYMIPNIIEIKTELPKNPNGKVDKKILQASLD